MPDSQMATTANAIPKPLNGNVSGAKKSSASAPTASPSARMARHSSLIVFIGVCLSLVFAGSVLGTLYALIFVTQPIGAQAPNDAAFIDILTTLTVFLTGALGSVLASNGLKDKPKDQTDTPKDTRES